MPVIRFLSVARGHTNPCGNEEAEHAIFSSSPRERKRKTSSSFAGVLDMRMIARMLSRQSRLVGIHVTGLVVHLTKGEGLIASVYRSTAYDACHLQPISGQAGKTGREVREEFAETVEMGTMSRKNKKK